MPSLTGRARRACPPQQQRRRRRRLDQPINHKILESKSRKLEQLVRLKDAKITALMAKLQAAGLL